MTAVLPAGCFDTHPPSKFFQALDEADQHLRDVERLEWEASFAPPVITGGRCICGSIFEARSSQIELTAEEDSVATAAIYETFGRSPDVLDAAAVAAVINAINKQRRDDDHAALSDWADAHAYCEGDYS